MTNYKDVLNIGFNNAVDFDFDKKKDKLEIKLFIKGFEISNDSSSGKYIALPRKKILRFLLKENYLL